MAMFRSFTSWHESRIFKLSINIFLGVGSCVVTFENHVDVVTCMHAGKCPTKLQDSQPTILVKWHQIKAWINEPMQMDIVVLIHEHIGFIGYGLI